MLSYCRRGLNSRFYRFSASDFLSKNHRPCRGRWTYFWCINRLHPIKTTKSRSVFCKEHAFSSDRHRKCCTRYNGLFKKMSVDVEFDQQETNFNALCGAEFVSVVLLAPQSDVSIYIDHEFSSDRYRKRCARILVYRKSTSVELVFASRRRPTFKNFPTPTCTYGVWVIG